MSNKCRWVAHGILSDVLKHYSDLVVFILHEHHYKLEHLLLVLLCHSELLVGFKLVSQRPAHGLDHIIHSFAQLVLQQRQVVLLLELKDRLFHLYYFFILFFDILHYLLDLLRLYLCRFLRIDAAFLNSLIGLLKLCFSLLESSQYFWYFFAII